MQLEKPRWSAQEASANFDELMRLAEEKPVIVTRDAAHLEDHLIVVSVDQFRSLLEQLKQAVDAIERLGPHDRGGGGALPGLGPDVQLGPHNKG
jgi:hypothetical protein